MKVIHAISNTISKVESFFIILILSIMILLAFLQVTLRNFFSISIFWGDILLRHLVLWLGFIGASLATREQKHINIDALSRLLSPAINRIIQIIVNLFASMVSYFLMRAAITFVSMEAESGSTLFADIPIWIAQVIIAIGFGLMMIRFLLHAIRYIFNAPTAEAETI